MEAEQQAEHMEVKQALSDMKILENKMIEFEKKDNQITNLKQELSELKNEVLILNKEKSKKQEEKEEFIDELKSVEVLMKNMGKNIKDL